MLICAGNEGRDLQKLIKMPVELVLPLKSRMENVAREKVGRECE